MSIHQVHVFISHSWNYSHQYDTIAEWIFQRTWRFGQATADFRNYSVPRSDPILNATNDRQLKEAIYRHIARAHVIVIPTGMYTHYSKWIGKEIEGARLYSKPILAVNLRGATRTSSIVGRAASGFCAWNSNSVVNAIWQLYYNR
ncbi:TIR domain-containing protein [Komagataeibacter oboediens]|uniref:TIR domain-containing protein n=1 Tax=Komagataeibacter oboediens TaxID=65958 RepID=UPI001C2D6928|nr:TIR domain-containing protein [Komagataeibacter oboediens]